MAEEDGRFTYTNDAKQILLFDEIRIQIKHVHSCIAMISLVDENDTTMPMPKTLTLYNTRENEKILPFHDAFFIVWFQDYELRYKNTPIFVLNNVREQAIQVVNNACIALQ
jgi:hypothetical protein